MLIAWLIPGLGIRKEEIPVIDTTMMIVAEMIPA